MCVAVLIERMHDRASPVHIVLDVADILFSEVVYLLFVSKKLVLDCFNVFWREGSRHKYFRKVSMRRYERQYICIDT